MNKENYSFFVLEEDVINVIVEILVGMNIKIEYDIVFGIFCFD